MNIAASLSKAIVGLACAGLVMSGPLAAAEPPESNSARPTPASKKATPFQDVALDRKGDLRGVVVDVQGAPVAHATVVIHSSDRELARTQTDGLGRFTFGPLEGGVYWLQAGRQQRWLRAWVDQTAPPVAKPLALVVLGDTLVRGQLPFEQFCASDGFVVCGLVAAMIAIPVAVHNSHGPVSPP